MDNGHEISIKRDMLTLGIESSCDETAVALVSRESSGEVRVHAHLILSQVQEHTPYGGVVPEIAARAHIFHIHRLLDAVVKRGGVHFSDIKLVAATSGPGLIGCVMVGLMAGKGMALGLGVPFVGVNHLAAHILVPLLTCSVAFPYTALLVSGGHTQVVHVQGVDDYVVLSSTKDDALGEAFDKVARLLGLGFPGGSALEKRAAWGNPTAYAFPRPMLGAADPSFSFSGLKTAVRQTVEKLTLTERAVNDVAASFQQAVVEALCDRLRRACRLRWTGRLCVVGGVAANQYIRVGLEALAREEGMQLIVPEPKLCTDNGAMVALAGLLSYEKRVRDELLTTRAQARWPLAQISVS